MITSKDNQQIKTLRKLAQKRARSKDGRFVAEGEDLVRAALAAGWDPEGIYHDTEAAAEFGAHPRAVAVEPEVLASASALGSGARVLALFPAPQQQQRVDGRLVLRLDGVADPGNVGTLIRAAAAFADAPVRLGVGCADPFSPKALRAAMGATFRHPPELDAPLPDAGAALVVLDQRAERTLAELEISGPVVICAGAERSGVSSSVREQADLLARIPMRAEGPESLNVAMAATIALHQLAGIDR